MTARRSLNLKLIFSVLAAFLLSLAFSWLLHDRLSERDAYALIDRTFENVQDELTDCINERLVLVCMAARELLEDGHPDDPASLQKLAHELRVTEISVADDKGDIIRSEQSSNDMYVSIDLVEEVIERQLKKYKNKIIQRHQSGDSFKKEFMEKDYMDEDEIRIVRRKQFDMKPMYPEDACVQMELLGHSFYIFLNAETEQLAVVYKRKGGTYGMIEAGN